MPSGPAKCAGVWTWTPGRWTSFGTIPAARLGALCLGLGVLWASPAWSQWTASTPAPAGWLQLPVGEDVYQALGGQSLAHLRIVDALNREQAFAVCTPQPSPPPVQAWVPVMPLNVGLRARIDAAGQLARQGGPGVEAAPPWTDWILDLREYPQDLLTIQLPTSVDVSQVQLRSSPNAQQWSRPLPFQATGHTLTLATPETPTLLRIDIDGGVDQAPQALELGFRSPIPPATLHWFSAGVPSGEPARVRRPYGIQGARLSQAPAELTALTLASRLNARDAWKSRGQWQPGTTPPTLTLATVGDREWRLQTQPANLELEWELAHAAHEIRLPTGLSLPLAIDIGDKPSRQLHCDDRRWQHASSTLSLEPLSATQSATRAPEAQPTNIRPWFLVLVAAVIAVLWWRKRRR